MENAKLDKFALSAKSIHRILKAKRLQYLYHANTTETSLTFIENNALLSRAYVSNKSLNQTPQKSDPEDKKYQVWDDVFLDGADLHAKYKRANFYGPVLFVLSLEMLLSPLIETVYVTRNNPMFWTDNDSLESRYYSDIDEIDRDYLTGKKLDSRIMFTIKSPENRIRLKKFLKHILLDNPLFIVNTKSYGKISLGDAVHNRLRRELDSCHLRHIPIYFRHENEGFTTCGCRIKYSILNLTNREEIRRLFVPAPPPAIQTIV